MKEHVWDTDAEGMVLVHELVSVATTGLDTGHVAATFRYVKDDAELLTLLSGATEPRHLQLRMTVEAARRLSGQLSSMADKMEALGKQKAGE